MRPTDEERRAVAARLREADRERSEPHPIEWFYEHKSKDPLLILDECMDGRELDCASVSVDDYETRLAHPLARLADLIEPQYGPDPDWLRWVESLKNGGVVDRFAYDLIVHGGEMGPNGNRWEGVDEGMVLTSQLFDKFRSDFKAEIEANGKEGK